MHGGCIVYPGRAHAKEKKRTHIPSSHTRRCCSTPAVQCNAMHLSRIRQGSWVGIARQLKHAHTHTHTHTHYRHAHTHPPLFPLGRYPAIMPPDATSLPPAGSCAQDLEACALQPPPSRLFSQWRHRLACLWPVPSGIGAQLTQGHCGRRRRRMSANEQGLRLELSFLPLEASNPLASRHPWHLRRRSGRAEVYVTLRNWGV